MQSNLEFYLTLSAKFTALAAVSAMRSLMLAAYGNLFRCLISCDESLSGETMQIAMQPFVFSYCIFWKICAGLKNVENVGTCRKICEQNIREKNCQICCNVITV